MCQQFMDIFGVSLLLNGLASVFIACTFVLKLLSGHLDGFTIGYGITILLQMFIFCYFGNELDTTTNGFVNDLFACDWIGNDIEGLRELRQLMTLHQQPITIKICGICKINLGFFKSVS